MFNLDYKRERRREQMCAAMPLLESRVHPTLDAVFETDVSPRRLTGREQRIIGQAAPTAEESICLSSSSISLPCVPMCRRFTLRSSSAYVRPNDREFLAFNVHVNQINVLKILEEACEAYARYADRSPLASVTPYSVSAVLPVIFVLASYVIVLGQKLSIPVIWASIPLTAARSADVKKHLVIRSPR